MSRRGGRQACARCKIEMVLMGQLMSGLDLFWCDRCGAIREMDWRGRVYEDVPAIAQKRKPQKIADGKRRERSIGF